MTALRFSSTARLLGTLFAVCMGAAPALSDEPTTEIPFLTTRDIATPDGPGPYFGDARSGLSAGLCRLRAVDTNGLDQITDALPAFLREQLLRVEAAEVLDPVVLQEDLQAAAQPSPLALFVHGYAIDFEKGCRRAALLRQNASLDDRLLWFSWPSDGDLANYPGDEADLYWSVPDLADVIIDLADQSAPDRAPDILGHSLGGRGVALALQEVALRRPDIRLGHVVLLAPDVDFGIFARLLPRISPIARSITVYVSDEDYPLALSAELHGYARLGEAENPFEDLAGVQVIDVSDLPGETASGHLYHIHSAPVGRDLNHLLNGQTLAEDRPDLVPTGPNVWSLRP